MTVIPESPAGGVTVKQQNIPANAQKATFAAGCFWGVEHIYRRRFGNGKGLLDASVGYCGGISKLPTYRQVCTGQTGRMFFFSFSLSILLDTFRSVVNAISALLVSGINWLTFPLFLPFALEQTLKRSKYCLTRHLSPTSNLSNSFTPCMTQPPRIDKAATQEHSIEVLYLRIMMNS